MMEAASAWGLLQLPDEEDGCLIAAFTFWMNEVWEGSQHKAHVPYKEVH
jgi:hypothetical protein